MDPKLIGKMVRFHRKKSGLSQEELALMGGLGKTAVFDVENGKLSIRCDTLLKILNVLNIKIDFTGPLMNIFKSQTDEKG